MSKNFYKVTYIQSANGVTAITIANNGVVTFNRSEFNVSSTSQYTFANVIYVSDISANGSLGSNGQVLKSGGPNGNTYWDYYQTILVMDNIGNQFDGNTTSYNVSVNGSNVSSIDINTLFLQVGSQQLIPSAVANNYVDLPEYVSRPNNSFSMTSNTTGSVIKFSSVPAPGTTFYGRIIPSSVTGRYTTVTGSNNYPLQAIAIATG